MKVKDCFERDIEIGDVIMYSSGKYDTQLGVFVGLSPKGNEFVLPLISGYSYTDNNGKWQYKRAPHAKRFISKHRTWCRGNVILFEKMSDKAWFQEEDVLYSPK